MKVCLFGASSNALDAAYYSDARKLGNLLALAGDALVYGGSERGIMKACADGIMDCGGRLIGVAPLFFRDAGVVSGRCSEVIYTRTMSERKQKMEDNSDAFIVLPGGVGTFDELFETITLKQLNFHSKPIVLLNTLDYFNETIAMLSAAAEKGFLGKGCLNLFQVCSTPEEAVSYIHSSEACLQTGSGLIYN